MTIDTTSMGQEVLVSGIGHEIILHRYMYLLGISKSGHFCLRKEEGISEIILPKNFVAILVWDHIITFGDEVKYIWTRPKILSSYWILFNRYLTLVGTIPVTVVKFSTMSFSSCNRYNIFWIIWVLVRGVVVYGSLCLRIYALYKQSRRILVIMVVAISLITGITLWIALDEGIILTKLHFEGCVVEISHDTVFQRLVPWLLTLVFDSFIFLLTLWKSWSMRHYDGVAEVSDPLIALMFRDGAIYYIFMVLATLANIASYYHSGPYTTEPLSTFACNLSGMMASRMFLNLHKTIDEGISVASWTDARDSYFVSSYFVRQEEGGSIRRRRGHAVDGGNSSVIVLDTLIWEDVEVDD